MARQHDLAAGKLSVMSNPSTNWLTDSRGRQYVNHPQWGYIANDPGERMALQRIVNDGRSHSRVFNTFRAAGIGIPAAAVAAPALLGGGGAASASAAPSGGGFWSGVTAPTFGATTSAAPAAVGGGAATAGAASAARFTLPSILRMAEIGVPAITSLYGMRSQNRALDRQAALEQQSLAEQLAFAREQDAYRRAEAERMFAEDRRRWETEERNTKEQRDFERRLIEEREARRAPFRAAGRDALYRLSDLIAMGRRRR